MLKKILIISPVDPYPVKSGIEEGIWEKCVAIALFAKVYIIFPQEKATRIPHYHNNIIRIPYNTKLSSFLFKKTKPESFFRAIYQTQFMNLKKIKYLIETIQPDIIDVQFPYIFPFLYFFIKNTPIVLTAHNIEYHLYKNKKMSFLLDWWELLSFRLAKKVFFLSYHDAIRIKKRLNKNNIFWIPMPINNEIGKKLRNARVQIINNHPIIIFLGSLIHRPNFEAVEIIINHIIPRVLKKFPNASFKIIGNYEKIPKHSFKKKKLEFLGFVNDLTEIFLTASVAIAPISSGSGVKTKVLNYLNAGIPTVVSRHGAEGIKLENEIHTFITDNWEQFSDYIIQLIKNQELAKKIVFNATKLIESYYTIQSISNKMKRLYEEK